MAWRAAVDLLPQLADEDVDRSVAVRRASPPDALEQLVSRQHAALLEGEGIDESELRWRQLALAVDVGLDVARVEPELLDHELVAALRPWARVPRRAAAPTRATSSRIENGLTR